MTLDGQRVENTLWFEFGTPPLAADLTALGDILLTWWGTNIGPLASQGLQVREVVCTSMHSAVAPQATSTPSGALTGGSVNEIMPNNVSMTVSFRTGLRGRSFRGRNYVTGLTIDQVTGNQIIPAVVADFIAAYEALGTAISGSGWTWIVASRFSGVDPTTKKPIPRAAGVTEPVIAVVVVDAFVDSQRRRLPTRGT